MSTSAPLATHSQVTTGRVIQDSDFINACYGRPVRRRPIWIMRQAGRYQASYRAVRSRYSFDEVCRTPELAAKVTLQPVHEFDLDAAIIFSDILVIFPPMGLPVHFDDGGPRLSIPIRRAEHLERVLPLEPELGVGFVLDAIRRVRATLPPDIPLIGFSGAPFTLACYAIEGTTSREFAWARRFFFTEPAASEHLMRKLSDAVAGYLNAQIDAGANAVQLFDTWAGLLSMEDYRRWVLPHMQELIARVRRPGIPVILYALGGSHLLEALDETGCDVLGVDWRTDIAEAAQRCRNVIALQGNLDPLSLHAPSEDMIGRAQTIMSAMDGTGKGHIFNLGHGVLPSTPEANVRALVGAVHSIPAARP